MASPNARIALRNTKTFKKLPEGYHEAWLNHLEALGSHSERPRDGEVFKDQHHCLRRLNAWGMREGCAYVTSTSRAKNQTPNWDFACVFHSSQSQNNWKLKDDRVVREEIEGETQVVSDRQRDTLNRRLGCPVKYYLSFRKRENRFQGKWRVSTHLNHAVPMNPFSLAPHRQSLPVVQQLKGLAQKYRLASLTYSEAIKLLREDALGVRLKEKEYYNLARNQPLNQADPDSAVALLRALQDEGFHYRTMISEEFDEQVPSKIVSRRLVQIVFWHPEARYLARRFVADHLLIVDATFNTNNLRMPLITSLGITNEGRALPIAFSYCPGESAESYLMFLRVVREDILEDDVPPPKVTLADMSPGIISAVKNGALLSGQSLQFCNWHAVQAILTRVRKGGYTSDEMEVVRDLT